MIYYPQFRRNTKDLTTPARQITIAFFEADLTRISTKVSSPLTKVGALSVTF
jgi:hypothetical protein